MIGIVSLSHPLISNSQNIDFEIDPGSVLISNTTIQFNNLSTGFDSTTQFIWNFGEICLDPNNPDTLIDNSYCNDTTLSLASIFHNYAKDKPYYIKLYAYDSGGIYHEIIKMYQVLGLSCSIANDACSPVRNGTFEFFDFCPGNMTWLGATLQNNAWNPREAVSCWYMPQSTHNSHYYLLSSCIDLNGQSNNIQIPNSVDGCQLDHSIAASSPAYVGVITRWDALGTSNLRSYIQQNLGNNLMAGVTYRFSFWVSLTDVSGWATNIGACLSPTPLIGGPGNTLINATPQIDAINNSSGGAVITDKDGWSLIEGLYTADGTEQYLTIGNFEDDNSANNLFIGNNDPCPSLAGYRDWLSKYFIDDVSLKIEIDLTIAGNNSFCQGSNTVLTASNANNDGPWTYLWSTGETTQSITIGTPGIVTVTVTSASGCTETESIQISEISSPTASISGDHEICSGGSSSFDIVFTGTGPWVYYYFDGVQNYGPLSSSISTVNIPVSPSVSTTYTLISVSSNGCNGTVTGSAITTIITDFEPPIIDGDPFECTQNPVYSVALPGPYQYSWSTSWGPSGSGTSTGNISPLPVNGTITFFVNDPLTGCNAQSTMTIFPCCTGPVGISDDLSYLSSSDVLSNLSSFIFASNQSGMLTFTGNYSGSPGAVIGTSPINITINGQFTVDENTNFGTCRIVMGPMAKIFIHPGKQLIMQRSYLSGCGEYMWDEITIPNVTSELTMISCQVEDGINAIHSHNGGVFYLDDNYFNKNRKSVKVGDYSGTHAGFIVNTTIATVDQLNNNIPASNCIAPFLGERSFRGIDISNVNDITVGSHFFNNTYANTFYNLDIGIFASNSNLTVENNHFELITRPAPPIPGEIRGFAIWVIGPINGVTQLNVGGINTTYTNTFFRCGNGIYARRNVSVSVQNNSFSIIRNNVSSFTRSNACAVDIARGINVDISNNQFDRCGFLNYGGGTGLNTGNGILIRDVLSSSINISNNEFNSISTSDGNVAIRLETDGTSMSNPNTTLVSNNIINESRIGISLSNYDNAQISNSNNITMPDAVPLFGIYYGIRLGNSSNVLINENIIQRIGNDPTSSYDFATWGISIETSSSNKILSNNLIKLGAGIRFFTTMDNAIRCNDLNHNRVGIRIVNSKIGDQGDPSQAHDNMWNDFALPYRDIIGQSNLYASVWHTQPVSPTYLPSPGLVTPTFLPGGSLWIDFQSAPPSNTCTNPQLLNEQREMADIANEEGDFYLLSEDEKYKLQKGVFLKIKRDSSWMNLGTANDIVLQVFYNIKLNTSMGQLSEVLDFINNENLVAASIVTSIQGANLSEYNEKAVLEICLEYLVNDRALTEDQYNQLYDIAIQNPISGGMAVYWARVIIEYDLDDIHIEDPLRLVAPTVYNISKSNNKFKLYPNPTKDELFLILNDDNSNGKLFIYDAIGKIKCELDLISGENRFDIVHHLNVAGMYTYRVEGQNVFLGHGKLVILK